MSLITWIILGLVSGFIASKLVRGDGRGLLFDRILSAICAVVGGSTFNYLGAAGLTGFNI